MLRHYSASLGMVCFRWFGSAELLVSGLKCLSEMSTFAVSLANSVFSQTAFLHHLLSHSVCVSALESKQERGMMAVEWSSALAVTDRENYSEMKLNSERGDEYYSTAGEFLPPVNNCTLLISNLPSSLTSHTHACFVHHSKYLFHVLNSPSSNILPIS